jgi:hypothetical protein
MSVDFCGHCGKQRILVAKVRSDELTMAVCSPCAFEAVKLSLACPTDCHGALRVEPFPSESAIEIGPAEGPFTQFFIDLSRN